MDDERFLKQLLATFSAEAQEHLSAMETLVGRIAAGLPLTEAGPAVEQLFREAHSLKGAARSVNLLDIERLCQSMERVLSAAKKGELAAGAEFAAAMRESIEVLGVLLAHRVGGAAAPEPGAVTKATRMLGALLALEPPAAAAAAIAAAAVVPALAPVAPPTMPDAAPPAALAPDTVRVATARLDALMTHAEDLQSLKLGVGHLAEDVAATVALIAEWRRGWEKHARHARLLRRAGVAQAPGIPLRSRRALAQLLESAERDDIFVRTLADRMARLERTAAQQARGLGARVDRLQDDTKQLLMLPLNNLLLPLRRQVRDLARDSGKDVELTISGPAIDVDRHILEQMKVPLLHLLRNAVDHGIETPDRRQQAGKPTRGNIAIAVWPREGNRIEIALVDDGAGIDFDRVKAAALRLGLATPDALAAMDEARLAELLFESGLSTSPIITDLSGHGLGLAIVREKIDALGGSITVRSLGPSRGTRFVVTLPATLATFRGLVVRLGSRHCVLPTRHVERVTRVEPEALQLRDGREVVQLADEQLAFAPLARLLELRTPSVGAQSAHRRVQVVVVCSGERRAALGVDEVVGDQEVMVKPLAPPLRRVRNVAGATLLGAGTVVPLLNVQDLFKSLQAAADATPAPRDRPEGPRLSLLVAEDSPTSRERIRGILEGAGYRVTTASDGMEALEALQNAHYDLLVTDVEMPRLDGFGLTARLRHDQRFSELPVILVTALETREDKERGMEVGANAYIVKSGFNQRRLLETVRTLV